MMMSTDHEPEEPGAELSAIRGEVDNIGVWLAIWAHRREPAEPDTLARRAAADAVEAIDKAIAACTGRVPASQPRCG